MLALPRFDTYDILPKYASHPNNNINALSFYFLKNTASRALLWDTLGLVSTGIDFNELLKLHIGKETYEPKHKDIASELFNPTTSISKDERDDIYMKVCAMAGLSVSKEALDNARADRNRKQK